MKHYGCRLPLEHPVYSKQEPAICAESTLTLSPREGLRGSTAMAPSEVLGYLATTELPPPGTVKP